MRDVIVVGSGGGGAVVAKELAARGLDVLILEAGARFRAPRSEWSHLEFRANNPAFGYLRFGPQDRRRPPWQRELAHEIVIEQVAGVGGTTLHYFGNSPRAMPGVFHGYSAADAAAYDRRYEFPLRYDELVPYYEWTEATLPVETAAMGRKEQAFLEAAARSGLPLQTSKDIRRDAYRPQENAILQPQGTAGRTADRSKLHFPAARGCTFCGFCEQGCFEPLGAPRNLSAKRSVDNSYIPMALTADRWRRGGRAATLVADAFVTRVDAETARGQTTARAVSWRDGRSGAEHSERAHVVVLAAGAIETPRLWLKSGLANPNGWVGRGLTDHALDFVLGILREPIGASRGPASATRADFPAHGSLEPFISTPAQAAALSTLSQAGFAPGDQRERLGADTVGRLVGPSLVHALRDVDRLLLLTVLTDDDVQPSNRVTLSPSSSDLHGPIARVDLNGRARTARTRRNRRFLVAQAVRIARAAGALSVHRIDGLPTLLHIHSSMRMGAGPGNSVVLPTGEARFVRRLFIADNSALPNSLGGPNPTLTTQALATRTAERIFSEYFGGEPWVRRESPTRSTDDEVTRAVIARRL